VTITLYRVDRDLWVKFRVLAITRGDTINEAVLEAIADWVNTQQHAQTLKRTT
jgi:hypothetical protein